MIIDADSHVCEPPRYLASRMSSTWGELIPRVKRNAEHDADMWYIGDHPVNSLALTVMYNSAEDDQPHRRADDFPAYPRYVEDVHPSSWDPAERVRFPNLKFAVVESGSGWVPFLFGVTRRALQAVPAVGIADGPAPRRPSQ